MTKTKKQKTYNRRPRWTDGWSVEKLKSISGRPCEMDIWAVCDLDSSCPGEFVSPFFGSESDAIAWADTHTEPI